MSIFNPQVDPTRDPNFFKYSDSISQPKADESTGIALKTVGEGIEGGFKLADTVVKDVIKSDVYDQVDKERKAFSTALTNTRNFGNPAGPNTPAGADPSSTIGEGTPGGPVDLFAGQKASVPSAINSGIRQAAVVQAGLDGNKISQTTYYQRLDDIAVKMRTAFPGYRDYIDQQISHITGVTPANAYVDSIIQDINRQSTNANKEKDFWTHQIVNSGFPDNDKVLAQFERDGDHNRVAQYLAYNNGIRSSLALKKAAFEAKGQDRTTQIQNGEDYASSAATTAAITHFYNSQKFTNGDQSPADIADKMIDLSQHPEKANDVAYQGLSERYAALHTQAYNQTMRLLTSPQKGPDGQMVASVSDTIGIEKTKAIVDKTVDALFGKTREFIADKQFSPAYSLQNAAAATQNNALFKIFQAPDIGGRVLTASALNKAAPNLTPVITGKLLGSGLDKDLSDFVSEQGRQAIAQTGGKYYGIDGKIYSFKQSLEELDQAGNMSGKTIPGQAFNNLLQIRKAITDPNATPESISNTVNYFYDPKVNKGSMNKFMDDYYDPAKGGMVKGRSSAFADLTEEAVTKAIWANGKNDWNKYSIWAKGEFATQFGSFARELNNAGKNTEGATTYMTHRLAWNADKKQFIANSVEVRDGKETDKGPADSFVRNINMGLRNLATIAKTEGTNVDAYLFKVLRDNGFTPTEDINGVPAQIMRSLIVGNGGKVKENAPSVPTSRFAPEDAGITLQQFLTNPAGSQRATGPSLEPQQTRNVVKGNLSDSTLLDIQTDTIPEGISARDFIKQLRAGK